MSAAPAGEARKPARTVRWSTSPGDTIASSRSTRASRSLAVRGRSRSPATACCRPPATRGPWSAEVATTGGDLAPPAGRTRLATTRPPPGDSSSRAASRARRCRTASSLLRGGSNSSRLNSRARSSSSSKSRSWPVVSGASALARRPMRASTYSEIRRARPRLVVMTVDSDPPRRRRRWRKARISRMATAAGDTRSTSPISWLLWRAGELQGQQLAVARSSSPRALSEARHPFARQQALLGVWPAAASSPMSSRRSVAARRRPSVR